VDGPSLYCGEGPLTPSISPSIEIALLIYGLDPMDWTLIPKFAILFAILAVGVGIAVWLIYGVGKRMWSDKWDKMGWLGKAIMGPIVLVLIVAATIAIRVLLDVINEYLR